MKVNKEWKQRLEMVEKEKNNQVKFFQKVDHGKSFVFQAGPGAGKTYMLIETIKHLLQKKHRQFDNHQQKIAVITYTNVAVNEVSARIGETEFLQVSTIHNFIWEEMNGYQKELVNIHKEYVKEEINKIDSNIQALDVKAYNNLDDDDKVCFLKEINKPSVRRIFHKYHYEKAEPSKNAYKKIFDFSRIGKTELDFFTNMKKFKKLVNKLYRKEQYQQALKSIRNEEKDFRKVEYRSELSYDRLDQMQISHDTVLIYAKRLIEKFPILRKVIIHKYPYILVDEFQDTRKEVIQILNTLDQYAASNEENFMVIYYGDEAQSIYENGVGSSLQKYHHNLSYLDKSINRRSHDQIVNIINKIRNDGYKQKSMYKDIYNRPVKFYHGNADQIKPFIEKYKSKWDISEENPLNCLFLTYRRIQDVLELGNFYKVMQNATLYREGSGYLRLSTELFSKDIEKLGEVQGTLYHLFDLLLFIEADNRSVSYLLKTPEISKNITLKTLENLIDSLRAIEGKTLKEILLSIEKIYEKDDEKGGKFRKLINYLFNYDVKEPFDLKAYKESIRVELGKLRRGKDLSNEFTEEKRKKAKQTLKDLLSVEKKYFINWVKYINNDFKDQIQYHTYQGTKGLEFNNQIIIMEERFARTYSFKDYFIQRKQVEKLKGSNYDRYIHVRNLFYVAASRAKKNLRILYIDDIDEIEEEVKAIFEKIYSFPSDENTKIFEE